MYHHVKKLMYTVNIGEPDVRFGNMLLEQFGGPNGELAAAMQYTVQAWNCVDDLGRRDLLLDIGTEELSHLEVVGALIRMHLAPLKTNREAAEADPLLAIAGGGGVGLFDSMGNAWTANYLKITGEITHMKAFQAALDSMEKKPFSIGLLKPTLGIVDEYFNGSTGDGSGGETDMRGPWSSSFGLHPVESEMNGGKGLSVQDVHGQIEGEDRGKQDEAQKASTSVGDEKIGKPKRNGNKPDNQGGHDGHE